MRRTSRWPLILAIGLIVLLTAGFIGWAHWRTTGTRAGLGTSSSSAPGTSSGASTSSAPRATTTTAPPTTAPPTTAPPTSVTTPKGPPALQEGASGPAVLALQRRLVALGYWLGEPDGNFASSTAHAVTAFQKAEGLSRDGVVGPLTAAALARAVRVTPRSRTGHLVEVDLSRQLLLLVTDGRVDWVFDTSTGAVPGTTPVGRYHVFRQVDGYDRSPLGVLYRPKYFVSGVAVHGYPSVPPVPASHGCVRVTNAAIDWLWSSGALPIGTAVWVY